MFDAHVTEARLLSPPKRVTRWSPIGCISCLTGIREVRLLFRAGAALEGLATKSWLTAPPCVTTAACTYFLPGQLERVTGMAYTDNPDRDMEGAGSKRTTRPRVAIWNAWRPAKAGRSQPPGRGPRRSWNTDRCSI